MSFSGLKVCERPRGQMWNSILAKLVIIGTKTDLVGNFSKS